MRTVSLTDVPLLSDRQPRRIEVQNVPTGPPHIWLHFDDDPVAEIVVDVGERDWSKLAYQLGHELGHVLANSWRREAKPRAGSQWMEEALVETFCCVASPCWRRAGAGIRHLPATTRSAARSSDTRPTRPGVYERYAAEQTMLLDPRAWFRDRRAALEASVGLTENCQALIPWLLSVMAGEPARVAEIGVLNLWPERTALPLEAWLGKWEESCAASGAAGWLPRRLRSLLLGG